MRPAGRLRSNHLRSRSRTRFMAARQSSPQYEAGAQEILARARSIRADRKKLQDVFLLRDHAQARRRRSLGLGLPAARPASDAFRLRRCRSASACCRRPSRLARRFCCRLAACQRRNAFRHSGSRQ